MKANILLKITLERFLSYFYSDEQAFQTFFFLRGVTWLLHLLIDLFSVISCQLFSLGEYAWLGSQQMNAQNFSDSIGNFVIENKELSE